MIKLDGSHGEGGGQIVRTALALSTLTGKAFEVGNIRKGRCDSGLKPQHVYCIKALQELSGAKADGVEVGSEKLVFYPGQVKARTLSIDVGTAGSITLLLQSLLLPLFFSSGKTRLKITGGTDVMWSEPYDYFKQVLLPHLQRFCDKAEVVMEQRGYYPKGGGKVEFTVLPKFKVSEAGSFSQLNELLKECPKISLIDQGKLSVIRGVSHSSSDLQKGEVAERQAASAKRELSSLGCPVNIEASYSKSFSTGSGITLWAVFENAKGEIDSLNPVILGSDALGEKAKRAEDVGKEAADALISQIKSKAPVDSYLADQLIPFMALCGGEIKVSSITQHTMTNIHVVEQFLGKAFEVDEKENIIRSA